MSWYSNMAKQLGMKKKEYFDLTGDEKQKALREMKLGQRNLEQKITLGEREMKDIALELVKTSKFKAPMLISKLQQRKALMAARHNAFFTRGMQLNALEICIELEGLLGSRMDKTILKQMEALSPSKLAEILDYLKKQTNIQDMNAEEIKDIMDGFIANVDKNVDRDLLEIVGEVQDTVLDKSDLSDEEKAKQILDMV
ncbi:hypothetical protein [Desulfobacter latus]|uniref:Uncharacterized protein n=1 Tax=Desulfobacter latus TaxID=2292 RepID=A0A850SZH0_9BACT|nr:hypothetical protein [Desulfobacter latus]NWH04823.1 hypothetical protein [Desulfobacter latus]